MKIYIPADIESPCSVAVEKVADGSLSQTISRIHKGDFWGINSKTTMGMVFPILHSVFNQAMRWSGSPEKIKWSVEFQKLICDAAEALASAKYGEAYMILQKSGIKEITPAVASYYLHLASHLNHEALKAVILDAKITCALWFLETKERKEWRNCLMSEEIISDAKFFKAEWNVSAYLKHLERVNYWATQLSCKPFEIDLFLLHKGTNCLLLKGRVPDENVSEAADILGI